MVKAMEKPPKPPSKSNDPALTVKALMPKPAFHRRVMTQPAQILERRRRNSTGVRRRSFSSIQSSSAAEKKDSKFSSFRRELIRGSSKEHRRSRSLPQSKRSTKLQTHHSKNKVGSGENFYVRVTLDSLTGITIQKGPKRKTKEYNSPIITGYASLLSSGHQVAVSKPFSVDHESSNSKLLWADVEGERSRDKRQLHFSLQLQREVSNSRDDDNDSPECKYHPKIVKLVIGLKCQDTMIPLGIASLVVTGKTALGEDIDLVMQSMEEMKDKRNKQLVPFFGSNKPEGISFFDDYFFSLSPDAILRANVDTKTDEIGKTKRQVWGDVDRHIVEKRSEVEETRVNPESTVTRPQLVQTKREPDHVPEEFMIPTPASPRSRRLKNQNQAVPPIEFIDYTAGANSITSEISSRRSIMEHPCEMTSNLVSSCFGGFCGNTDTVEDEVNELKLSEDRYNPTSPETSPFVQKPLDSSSQASQEMLGTSHFSSFEIAEKSYEDLRDAQETLRRYAKKTGIDVEDILDQGEPLTKYASLQV